MENEEILEKKEENTDEYSGTFHERDSLTENNIVNEVRNSFLDYSMSVITSRAIPDLRDGLKPGSLPPTRGFIYLWCNGTFSSRF